SHNAADHLFRGTEVVLVMRALGSAIGDDERSLTRAPSAPGALCVIRRCWWHVAHVDSVERRDVDAELHSRRAEQGRQKDVGLARNAQLLAVFLELFSILFPPTKTPFSPLSSFRIDLRGVFTTFKTEHAFTTPRQRAREIAVECREVRVRALAVGASVRSDKSY